MSRIVIREDRCKGCLLCTTVCPKGIIKQSKRFNAMGYKVVEVPAEDMAECTGCASCARMCPDCVITVWKTSKSKEKAHVAE